MGGGIESTAQPWALGRAHSPLGYMSLICRSCLMKTIEFKLAIPPRPDLCQNMTVVFIYRGDDNSRQRRLHSRRHHGAIAIP